MPVVKGTKLRPLKVVENRPWQRMLFILVLLLTAAAGVRGAYFKGLLDGKAGQAQTSADLARLEQELATSRVSVEELQQQLANINLGAEVDRQSAESVRQEVIQLKDQLSQLEEENSFYRNLMAPTDNKRGLNFGAVEIVETDKTRAFGYKVVLQQLATNHELLTGTLTFNIIGRLNGFDATFSLNQLSDSVSEKAIRLRFKYFQTVQGVLSLPEGFEPERIELVAKSTGKTPVTVEKRFGWLVEET
ncbi:DUF6776 family protein [Teredinibacter waterburyi]|uniref:DUF6776 family protein n=1 Tax=Teredinibacter waterburyi TaxID=1500538 RepID=UPI00165EC35D|nr:DUF6776 family protein [Teredinibacter waterburyi]